MNNLPHMNNHYNSRLREHAHELRTQSMSKAEKRLWSKGLARSMRGVKFKRQRPIDKYIVDFFCQELNLIIEIDGNSHITKGAYDAIRSERLKKLGYEIKRFSEGEILMALHQVLNEIDHLIVCLKEQSNNFDL